MINFQYYVDQIIEWNNIAGSQATEEQQRALVIEEARELVEAFESGDPAATLKEATDLLVVSCYFDNITNYPSNYRLYTIAEIPFSILQIKRRLEKPLEGVIGISYYATSILASINADVEGAMQAVIDSNMSKFPVGSSKEKQQHLAEAKRIEENSDGRYKGVKHSYNNGRVIYRDENNKIMKPDTYTAPNIGRFVYGG